MALIKCEECGKQVSDKADNCPHCGAPVEVIKCEECGKTFNNELDLCPHCGAPVEILMSEKSTLKTNECSIWGFVLSIISIFFHPISFFSTIVCICALYQIKNYDIKEKGEGLAIAGAIISILMLLTIGFNLLYGEI